MKGEPEAVQIKLLKNNMKILTFIEKNDNLKLQQLLNSKGKNEERRIDFTNGKQ